MISALHALIVQSTPHFKIWLNDEKVVPPFQAFVSTVVPSSPLYDILQQPDEPKEMMMDPSSSLSILCKDGRLLESLLSFILVSERTLLQQLVEMQMLDVLDADGAILVYDQLVFLCQGDQNKAQTLVESSLFTIDLLECSCKCSRSVSPGLQCAPLDHLLRFSPYTFPRESVNLLALLTLMDDFQSWFQRIHDDMHHWDSDIDDKYLAHLDEFYKNACSLISQLDIDDCVYLLQNWLLSLTMCDITMFLNIIPVNGNANAKLFSSTLTDSNEVETMELARRQSTNASGCVIMRLGKGTSILWDYKINIIDWDRKPAKKLQDLRKREEPIQFLSASG
jgi:inositol-pentakisphosphate 2-kinase